MVRCKLPFVRALVVFSFFAVTLAFVGAPSSPAQNFRPDSPEDKRAEGTVSVRDLGIPAKAFEDFQRGLQELGKQETVRSIRSFTKAIEKYPQYYEAYYHLGVAERRLGQDDKAMASFQTAIDLSNGKYALAEYGYALLLAKTGKTKDAEQSVRYGLELDQNRPIGEVVLATVLLTEHRVDEAEKHAREALSLDSNACDAYLVLAALHGQRGEYADEVQDLDSFLTIEPNSARTQMIKGIRDVAEGLATRAANKP
jgi:tetratricopeptide (TPR) repeat protein